MGGGPPDFPPDYPCPVVLWILARSITFRLRGCYPLWLKVPNLFGYMIFALRKSLTPGIRRSPVWALSRSLAATKKIDVSFSSSGYLDVSVHRVPLISLFIHDMMTRFHVPRSRIRKSMGQSLLTAHHGLSQLTTSFFGSWCQGIHPMLLLA